MYFFLSILYYIVMCFTRPGRIVIFRPERRRLPKPPTHRRVDTSHTHIQIIMYKRNYWAFVDAQWRHYWVCQKLCITMGIRETECLDFSGPSNGAQIWPGCDIINPDMRPASVCEDGPSDTLNRTMHTILVNIILYRVRQMTVLKSDNENVPLVWTSAEHSFDRSVFWIKICNPDSIRFIRIMDSIRYPGIWIQRVDLDLDFNQYLSSNTSIRIVNCIRIYDPIRLANLFRV